MENKNFFIFVIVVITALAFSNYISNLPLTGYQTNSGSKGGPPPPQPTLQSPYYYVSPSGGVYPPGTFTLYYAGSKSYVMFKAGSGPDVMLTAGGPQWFLGNSGNTISLSSDGKTLIFTGNDGSQATLDLSKMQKGSVNMFVNEKTGYSMASGTEKGTGTKVFTGTTSSGKAVEIRIPPNGTPTIKYNGKTYTPSDPEFCKILNEVLSDACKSGDDNIKELQTTCKKYCKGCPECPKKVNVDPPPPEKSTGGHGPYNIINIFLDFIRGRR